MTVITAIMVKELRTITNAGMMDCKKALAETSGNMDASIELLRKKGMASADKKAGRIAAEGVIAILLSPDKKKAAISEVNCETDFVAKGDEFKDFSYEVTKAIMNKNNVTSESILNEKISSGITVDERRRELISKIGENMTIRRLASITADTIVGHYQHGEKIGVVVSLKGGNESLAKDIAMHIAATNPKSINSDDLNPEVLEKEKSFQIEQAKSSGKPIEIIEKMIEGRMRKFLKEITLVGQPFIKDTDQTIENLLKSHLASVTTFIRFEVGEGLEIQETNFADEVAEAARLAQQ